MRKFQHSATVDWGLAVVLIEEPPKKVLAKPKPAPLPVVRWVRGRHVGWHVLQRPARDTQDFHITICRQEVVPRFAKFRDAHPGKKTVECEVCLQHAETLEAGADQS